MWPFCCFEIMFFVSGTFPFLEEYIARHYCSNSVFFILSVCIYYYFPFQSFCVFILKCVSCRQHVIESAVLQNVFIHSLRLPYFHAMCFHHIQCLLPPPASLRSPVTPCSTSCPLNQVQSVPPIHSWFGTMPWILVNLPGGPHP